MAGINGSTEAIYEQIQDQPTRRLGLGQPTWQGSTQSLWLPENEGRSQLSPSQSRKKCMLPITGSKALVPTKERKQATSSSSIVGSGLNLEDLAGKRADYFPIRVKIIKKKTSESAWSHVSVGETYNIYSIKEEKKAVTFSDPSSGETFTLFSDAKVRCALVYSLDPENSDNRTCTAGYTFKNVSDIIKAQPMPKMVCATRMGSGRSIDSVVIPGEIMRVTGTQSDKRCLVVYSYTLECTKVLDEECQGNFTTKPTNVHLPLAQLITDLSLTFPCKVQLFPSSGNQDAALQQSATSRILWMNVPSNRSVIVASNTSEPLGKQLVEIPVSSDIEVVEVEVFGKELLELMSARFLNKEDLLKDAESSSPICHATKPAALSQTYMPLRDAVKASTTAAQSIYNEPATPKELSKNADLTDDASQMAPPIHPRPPMVTNETKGTASLLATSAATTCTHEPQLKDKEPSQDTALGTSVALAIEERFKCNRVSRDSAITQVSVSGDSTGDCDIETLRIKYAEVKEDLEKCQCLLKEYRDALTSTQKDVDYLKRNMESIYARLTCTNEDEGISKVITEQNKTRLATFSIEEVVQLLDALGLSQYKKKFMAERVSGKLLLQCNDKVLERDLGVNNKLHRLQLMTMIEGKECAYSIIAKM